MESKTNFPIPDFKTLAVRGWQRRCPQCGKGKIYRNWIALLEHCPECGLKYLEYEGDLFGPLVILDRLLFLIPFITIFFFRLWHPSLILLLLSGGVMLFLLIYTMPHRNGVSLAFDYYIRRRHTDLADRPDAGKDGH